MHKFFYPAIYNFPYSNLKIESMSINTCITSCQNCQLIYNLPFRGKLENLFEGHLQMPGVKNVNK